MSYWPELGSMLISETITDKRHGIILTPVCLNLNLKVEVVSLRYIGYVEFFFFFYSSNFILFLNFT